MDFGTQNGGFESQIQVDLSSHSQQWHTHKTSLLFTLKGIDFIEQLFYTVLMKTDIKPKTGKWLLVMGSRAVVPTLLKTIIRLAEAEPSADNARETAYGDPIPHRQCVRVVDGGFLYDARQVNYMLHGRKDLQKRIQVNTAEDCYELLSILERMPKEPTPIVVLDLLSMFFDPFIWGETRMEMLAQCLNHLDRLAKSTGVLVSIHPPNVITQTDKELLDMVTEAAKDTYHVNMATPAPVSVRMV
jgi:hypothetical protein